MFKLTRKGLSLGTLVALGASLISGAPAQAAANMALVPSAGTGYTLPAGDVFSLTETASAEIPSSSWGTLKFKVVNTDGVAANAIVNSQAPVALGTTAGGATVLTYTYVTAANNNTLKIDSTTAVDSRYVVTAWLDTDADSVIDATELASPERTVAFTKLSSIAATTTLDTIYKGASTATAHVTLSGINADQANDGGLGNAHAVTLDWKKFSGGVLSTLATGDSTTLTDGVYSKTYTTGALAAGDVITVQAKLDGTAVGSLVTGTVTSTAISTITASTVASSASKATGAVAINGTYQVKAVGKDDEDVVVPSRTISVAVTTSATLSSTVSLTLNGTKYSANSALPGTGSVAKLALTTDANGAVLVNVASTGLVEGQTVTFSFTGDLGSDTEVTTQTAKTYSAVVTNLPSLTTAAQAGGTVTVNVSIFDQFGNLATDTYDVRALLAGSPRSGTAATSASNKIVPIANGQASLAILDNGTGTGYNLYSLDFVKRDPTTGNYGTPSSIGSLYIYIVSAADATPGVININNTTTSASTGLTNYNVGQTGASATPGAVATFDFGNYDTRIPSGTEPSYTGTPVTIAGNVKSATTSTYTGVTIAGVPVTIAAAGLQFKASLGGGQYLYAQDTITVPSDVNGEYSVVAWSHKTGAVNISVAAGTVSKTLVANFDAAAANTGYTLTLTAPTFSLPGRSVAVVATLTDKYGNPVKVPDSGVATNPDFKLSATGVGTIGAAVLETGTDGKATLVISLGANELGNIAVTATYDADGTGTTSAAITKTAVVVVAEGAPVPSDAKLTVSVPATAQSGRSVDVTVTVTDAAGKAIDNARVKLAITGLGYLQTSQGNTDAAGKFTTKLIVGSSETGSGTLVTTAGSLTDSKTITFGVTDGNLNIAGKRVTADWSYAAGKRIVIYRNGIQIRNFVPTSDAAGSFSFNLKKGTWKVTIKIGGVTVDSQTYKIK